MDSLSEGDHDTLVRKIDDEIQVQKTQLTENASHMSKIDDMDAMM